MDHSRLQNVLRSISHVCGTPDAEFIEEIQTLWSGYGSLFRAKAGKGTVIAKWISPPAQMRHPRGFGGAHSHARKLRSYRVEREFYERWSSRTNSSCRVPALNAVCQLGNESILVLEDLDAAGFSARFDAVSDTGLRAILDWLASFHAQYLGIVPEGL